MKSSLTAAVTVLVSSAGAVGLAGTAVAAPAVELPAAPSVGLSARNASDVADTMRSAAHTVGDVVTAVEQPNAAAPASRGTAVPRRGLVQAAPVDKLLSGTGVVPASGLVKGSDERRGANADGVLDSLPVGKNGSGTVDPLAAVSDVVRQIPAGKNVLGSQ